MLIQFKKKSENVLHLVITRTDGSQTWSKIYPGLHVHDIAHYAVEKVLQLKNGFFGIINRGVEIEDFESHERRNRIPEVQNLPVESIQTEHIVNLLQIEYLQKTEKDAFINNLYEVLIANDLPLFLPLTEEKLEDIRKEFYKLAEKLIQLRTGDMLELELNTL